MRLHKYLLAGIATAIFAMPTIVSADIVLFDFNNGGVVGAAEDNAGDPSAVGDTITVGGLQLTLVGTETPEYVAGPAGGPAFVESGTTLTNGNLSIGGQNALGINNLSINNGNFDMIGGGTESTDINPGESFTFTFDQDVSFTAIELESVVATDEFEVLVDGTSVFSTVGEDAFVDFSGSALNDLTITAGQEITFAADGNVSNGSYRIETFSVHVQAVPEPSSLALLGLFGSVAMIRRRR